MNTFEIIILALALVFNSWTSYLKAGMVLAYEPLVSKLNYAGIMFLLQFLMAGIGIWAGNKAGITGLEVNMMISLCILFIMGLKVLLAASGVQPTGVTYDYLNTKETLLSSMTEGIIPLVTGIVIGLLSSHLYFHWLLTGAFLLSGIITGFFVGSHKTTGLIRDKSGSISGLLLLAAAIKLTLNLSGF